MYLLKIAFPSHPTTHLLNWRGEFFCCEIDRLFILYQRYTKDTKGIQKISNFFGTRKLFLYISLPLRYLCARVVVNV